MLSGHRQLLFTKLISVWHKVTSMWYRVKIENKISSLLRGTHIASCSYSYYFELHCSLYRYENKNLQTPVCCYQSFFPVLIIAVFDKKDGVPERKMVYSLKKNWLKKIALCLICEGEAFDRIISITTIIGYNFTSDSHFYLLRLCNDIVYWSEITIIIITVTPSFIGTNSFIYLSILHMCTYYT